MRAFFAVLSDPAWVTSAAGLSAKLRASLPRASWTRPEAWHLTLRFLGELDERAAEEFAKMIGPRASASAGGELASAGAVVFPPRGRPRVLGVAFRPSETLENLSQLAGEAESAARSVGAAPQERPFCPHVTLARIRDPWPRSALDEFRRETDAWTFPTWQVRSCALFQSRLDPAGAVHTPLHEWSMNADRTAARV